MQKIKFIVLSTLFLSLGMFTSCNNKVATDVMIVGVNEGDWDEISVVIDNLNNCNKQTINNINYYTGKIDNKNVVVAEALIGTSEAAITTTIGIEHFNPKCVITEGTSGGHHEGVTYNDIILGKDVLNMASYKGDPFHPEGDETSEKIELQHPILHSDQTLLNKAKNVKKPVEGTRIVENGVIASSDCWNTGKEYVNALHSLFKEDCEEMESYAVLNVCAFYNTPALAIRIISNNLIRGEEFNSELKVGENGQIFTIELVKAI